MGKSNLKLVTPSTVFGTVQNGQNGKPNPRPPRKRKNAEVRSREYLTEAEVERLIRTAASNRHAHRDQLLLLLIYRHGLRSAEAARLRWDALDFDRGELAVSRLKGSKPGVHPLSGRELRMLRKLKREQNPSSPFVFTSERKGPFALRGLRAIVERLSLAADLEFPAHLHMLRHACGFKLANDEHSTRTVQDYLGHRNIQHTVRYTELSPGKFRGFWKD